jgi:phosphoribosyl-dephospho-CoA transferase
MKACWKRHDLLTVHPHRWPAWPGSAHWLSLWAARGWPLMVRRYRCGEPRGRIPVAIALPPRGAGGRTPGPLLSVHADDVRAYLPALSPGAALPVAPAAWHEVLRALARLGARHDSSPTLFGSLLWAAMTGLPYLTARSDLDLLWPIRTARQASSLAHDIALLEAAGNVRIDGEFVLPDGAALAWREWPGAGGDVLVKTLYGVEQRRREALFDVAPARAAVGAFA